MNPAQHLLTFSLRAYRLVVSPVLHFLAGPLGGCRFTPSCSVYAGEAVRRHGARRGGWLALCRVARCHPWGGCGPDPVPEPFNFQNAECQLSRDRAAEAPCFCRPSGVLSHK